MRPDDILQPAIVTKKQTTMFEWRDGEADRNYDYGKSSGSKYVKPFIEFIESLGFEVVQNYEGSTLVKIDGFEFSINTANASYKSKGSWTRRVDIRKPENRFITITNGNYNSTYVLKVHVNKELETEKLKKKINKAIDEKKAVIKRNEDTNTENQNNTTSIALHYLNNDDIKKQVQYIVIEKGIIIFNLHETGRITVFSDNKFRDASFYTQEMKTLELVESFKNTIPERSKAFSDTIAKILAAPKISEELAAWASTAYHRTFYTKTMSTEY